MGEVVGWFWLVWDSRWAERTWRGEAFVYFFCSLFLSLFIISLFCF
jgi:hypothetical protein